MEQLLPSAAAQLLRDGYTVLWLPSSDPLAKCMRDGHRTAGALFSTVANSAPARAALQSVSASESNIDYAAGLFIYDKESSNDGRINCTIRGPAPGHIDTSSSSSAVVFNDLRDHLVSLQSSLTSIIASLLREAGASVFSNEPGQYGRGVPSFLKSLVLSDDVPAAAAGGPAQPVAGTASSITAQCYGQPHNAVDSHIDCTLATVSCPSVDDRRLQVLHQGAWVSPLTTNPGTGQPVVIWAGHLLDVALGRTGAAARACHHRVQAASSSGGQATTTARVSIVLRVKPHDEAILNPPWVLLSLPESAARRCKDVVAAFRAQYVSVNHPAYVPESAAPGAGAGAGASTAGGSPGEQQAGVKRARGKGTAAVSSSVAAVLPAPQILTITVSESVDVSNSAGRFEISLEDLFKGLVHCRVKPTTRFQKVFDAFYTRRGAEPGSYRFTYEEKQVYGKDTPGKLGMEDGAKIEATVKQTGAQQAGVKRARTEGTGAGTSSGAAQAPAPERLTLTVREGDGTETVYSVKPTTRFEKIYDAFFIKKGAAMGSYRFLYDGDQIDRAKTPGNLGMEDGAVIDATVQQFGD